MSNKHHFNSVDLEARLREKGLKVTPLRLVLLKRLGRAGSPQSIKELVGKLNADTVTVYRAVSALEKAGLLARIDIGHNHPHFELSLKHHHHIICSSCGIVEHMELCVPEAFFKKTAQKSTKFASIDSHKIECYARCRRCS